jgi:transcriptional regulator with XRE-family HTH domain
MDETIGERLQRLRRAALLTQEALAERAEVSVHVVQKLEQGTRRSAPTDTPQVAMQEVHAFALVGEPGRALEAAGRVRRSDLRTISWCRHLLDLEQAQVDAGDLLGAEGTLQAAEGQAAEWFRHQRPARASSASWCGKATGSRPACASSPAAPASTRSHAEEPDGCRRCATTAGAEHDTVARGRGRFHHRRARAPPSGTSGPMWWPGSRWRSRTCPRAPSWSS